jgi:TonB family protein
MALPIWVHNLSAYGLQIAILASVGTLLAYLFRLRVPRVALAYWQILLLACLLLPGTQNWKHPVQFRTLATSGPVVYDFPIPTVAPTPKPSFSITPEMIGLVLGTGICLRLIWLVLGFVRLRRFVRNSQALPGAVIINANLSNRIGRARFFLSDEIDSPATFGIFSPTVILPRSFSGMSEACREALVCHELLHVRRHDWALILIEEIIRSAYWFHPAIWWLMGRIHLAREQSVDREVVRLTGSRQPYLDSLLEIARSRGRPRAVPAPLFLRERHLVQRVALLIKEVSMNRIRLVVSLAGIAILLAGTIRLAAAWFPLTGEPQVVQQPVKPEDTQPARDSIRTTVPAPSVEMAANTAPATLPPREPVKAEMPVPAPEAAAGTPVAPPQRPPIRVGGNVQESKLIHRVEPVYPEVALRARVQGRVILTITVNEEGFVSDVQVVNGHPLLSDAAIAAVKQWQYSPTLLNGKPVTVIATVTVIFAIKGDQPETGSDLTVPLLRAFPAFEGRAQINGAVNVFRSDGLGGAIVFRATPVDEKGKPFDLEMFHSPELSLNGERLHALAEAGWPAQVEKTNPIVYSFVLNEAGEIRSLTRIAGPDIPEVQDELVGTRIISVGLRGTTPVSCWCVIEVRLQANTIGGVPGGVVGNVIGGASRKR